MVPTHPHATPDIDLETRILEAESHEPEGAGIRSRLARWEFRILIPLYVAVVVVGAVAFYLLGGWPMLAAGLAVSLGMFILGGSTQIGAATLRHADRKRVESRVAREESDRDTPPYGT